MQIGPPMRATKQACFACLADTAATSAVTDRSARTLRQTRIVRLQMFLGQASSYRQRSAHCAFVRLLRTCCPLSIRLASSETLSDPTAFLSFDLILIASSQLCPGLLRRLGAECSRRFRRLSTQRAKTSSPIVLPPSFRPLSLHLSPLLFDSFLLLLSLPTYISISFQ